MPNRKLSVILVDDHPVFLEGLKLALEGGAYTEVVGTFTTVRETLVYLKDHKVDIAIVDIVLTRTDGFTILKKIDSTKSKTKVLFLSGIKNSFTVKRSYDSGVHGYITKDAPIAEVFKALETIRKNEIYIAPEFSDIGISISGSSKMKKEVNQLSSREKEILAKICAGQTTQSIAVDLDISTNTVNNHRKSILKKTESSSQAALIKYAHDNGYSY